MLTHREALEPIAAHRGDRVVMTTMGSVALWPALSDTPRDFHFLPSSMGQGVPLGLGLCLAKPGLSVVVLVGDGGLLMNLGCLVTAASHELPLFVVLIENGLYEVTGGQPVPGRGCVDYSGLARAAGFSRVFSFQSQSEWEAQAAAVFSGTHPTFVWLKVMGETGKATPSAPRPMAEQIARLQEAIGVC